MDDEYLFGMTSVEYVQHFAKLEDNWNGYGAPPIPQKIVDRTLELVEEHFPLRYKGGVGFQVFPTGRETVQIERSWPNGDYFEIEIYPTHYEGLVEHPSENYQEFSCETIEECVSIYNALLQKREENA